MKLSKSIWLVSMMVSAVILSACNLGATAVPTQDVGAIETQAFNLVMTEVAMQQTQAALLFTPTPAPTLTPFPTATLGLIPTAALAGADPAINPLLATQQPNALLPTPVPTLGVVSTLTTKNGCNDGILIGESAPFDGDKLKAGKAFEKVFTLVNMGTCAWDEGYTFAFNADLSTPGFNGYDIVYKKTDAKTEPGHSQSFVLKLKVPNVKGQEVEYIGVWKLKDDAGNEFGSQVWVKIIAVP